MRTRTAIGTLTVAAALARPRRRRPRRRRSRHSSADSGADRLAGPGGRDQSGRTATST